MDFALASIFIGQVLDEANIREVFKKQYHEIQGGRRWFIQDFIDFQYGELKDSNRMHGFVLRLLKKQGVLTPLKCPSQGAKDKDKDKDKDKGVSKGGGEFSAFWDSYPSREGKKLEKAATLKEFFKIPEKDHTLVVIATRNYANSTRLPKDPKRFLKDDFWREWIEPAEANIVSCNGKTPKREVKRNCKDCGDLQITESVFLEKHGLGKCVGDV